MAIDLEKLIELEAAATPRPWGIYALSPTFVSGGEPKRHILQAAEMGDRYFVTALRNAAPELFKRIRHAEKIADIQTDRVTELEMENAELRAHEAEARVFEEMKDKRIRELETFLTALDRRGGLGLDVHENIRQLLAPAAVEGE